MNHSFFELYPILIGTVIVWVFASILTAAGAYDHASALGQRNCRIDRSGLVSGAPWYFPSLTLISQDLFTSHSY